RRCRLKLKAPTANPRSAFCCRGCFRMFFEKRCLVCEDTKSKPRRLICSRPACSAEYAALKRHEMLGTWAGSARAQGRSANPIKIGVPEADIVAPAYRIVAGPTLTSEQLRLATVGAGDVLRSNRATNRRLRNGPTLIGPRDAPLN